ncbi:M10 family metallopeptidase C-terminal domain-containing protein, partial [Inquilinus limosus]|uniref:calcium-binding protein n=1 Tax=Inquilinus limosus TaxID=171674 RepID=UPI003F18FB96
FSLESPFQLLVNLVTNVASGGTASGDTFYSIENLIGSDDRIDRFIGGDEANYFLGLGGGDVLSGGGGDDKLEGARDGDVLNGDAGNDTLIGGAGADYLDGGDGIDTADYTLDERQPMFGPPRTPATEGVTLDLAAGTARGGDGEGDTTTTHQFDRLVNIENVIGSKFADTLIGNAGVNVLSGAAGDDTLAGGGGADTLDGGAGLDILLGNAGKDTLSGGAGADLFTFSALGDSVFGTRADVITDFRHAQGDRIDLSGIDADTGTAGDQGFSFIGSAAYSGHAGELRFASTTSSTTTVAGDVDGDGRSDFHIVLTGRIGLTAGDFVL